MWCLVQSPPNWKALIMLTGYIPTTTAPSDYCIPAVYRTGASHLLHLSQFSKKENVHQVNSFYVGQINVLSSLDLNISWKESVLNVVNPDSMFNLLITIFNLNDGCMKKGISSSDLMFRAWLSGFNNVSRLTEDKTRPNWWCKIDHKRK
mgnify:CR=1 FL=1